MAIDPIGGGGYIITGKRDIALLRLNMLVKGLRWEIKTEGRLTAKAPKCYTQLRNEYGFKGNRANVLTQAVRLLEQTEARRHDTPDDEQIIVPETPPQ